MLLKVGELAKKSGLTVRTLHHYDAIGLLTPSARADNGYRLYNRDDIARLHRIQALRGSQNNPDALHSARMKSAKSLTRATSCESAWVTSQ